MTDVPDAQELRWTDYPEHALSLVPYMRTARLSVFSGSEPDLLGKLLDSMFNLASHDECTGELESATVVAGAPPGSLRLTGWAWDYKHHQPPSMIVMTNDGVITGLGAMGDWRPVNKASHSWMTSKFIGYTGYVRGAESSSPVKVYAVLRGSPATACWIATAK